MLFYEYVQLLENFEMMMDERKTLWSKALDSKGLYQMQRLQTLRDRLLPAT
jgi:hypothetical protein